MKKFLLFLIIGTFCFVLGRLTISYDFEKTVKDLPRGSMNIPAQWFIKDSVFGLGPEKMMLIFGYADNFTVCQNVVEMAKIESPGQRFTCIDAN